MHRAFGESSDIDFVDALYNASAETYLALLGSQNHVQSVMVIGHNPAMEEVLEALIGTDRMAAIIPGGYPTAGLAVLDHGGPVMAAAGNWQLRDFLTADR
jgi:phosphohistidine phosphatase